MLILEGLLLLILLNQVPLLRALLHLTLTILSRKLFSITTNNDLFLHVFMKSRKIEYAVAVLSFITAVVLAFVSLIISDQHEVAAGNCTLVAQFLLLTASIFGIDYKLNHFGSATHTVNNKGTYGNKEDHQSGNITG